jgi:Flp pilus assembly pilin Flp
MLSISETLDLIRAIRKREDGQTMAEYGVVLAVLTIAAVGVFQLLGGSITTSIKNVIGYLP